MPVVIENVKNGSTMDLSWVKVLGANVLEESSETEYRIILTNKSDKDGLYKLWMV